MTENPRISIVLATYNERENIAEMVRQIFASLGPSTEVIVVDDDSPDKTWEVVQNLNQPSVRLIRRIGERGLASAFYRGIQESCGEFIGWMDADLTMPPALLPQMLDKLSECDVVVASRYVKNGRDDRSFLRVSASWCINQLARIILNPNIHDFDSGFVLLRRDVIENVPMIATGYGEYFMEFLYAASKRYRICEIPYHFRDREQGISKSAPNLTHFFRTGLQYIARIFAARFRN